MERYWNEEIETMSREDMKKLQDEIGRAHV